MIVLKYINQTIEQVACSYFYGCLSKIPNKADRKKFSYATIRTACDKASVHSSMIVAEKIYNSFIEIRNDEAKSSEQKLDLILGDIEIILLELLKDFSIKHDMRKMISGISIEEMKIRYGLDKSSN